MKHIRLFTAACALALVLSPALARADNPCTATTLNLIAGTTCTIGDKTFNFAADSGVNIGDPFSATQIEFTPIATDPLSPGFELSLVGGGAFTISGSGNSNVMENVFLNYTVSTTSGQALITGETVTINNPSVTLGTLTSCSNSNGCENAITDATNFLGPLVGGAVETFFQCQFPVQQSGCSTSASAPTLSTGGTFAPVNSATGQAGFELFVQTEGTGSSASASLTSVDYHVTEIPAPEPSMLLLLGTGLVGFAVRQLKTRL